MRKLRHQEMRVLVQVHTARKGEVRVTLRLSNARNLAHST